MPGPQTVDGVRYDVALVQSELLKDWTLSFASDGRLARMEYQTQGPQGPAHATVKLSDWRAVGKIQYPHQTQVLMDGKPFLESRVTQARFNEAIPDSMFRKPNL